MIHISQTDLSDAHKDAFGFRPRGIYKEWWTQAELEAEYQRLSEICRENEIREKAAEHQALIKFNKLVDEVVDFGAGTVDKAIRWLVEAEGLTMSVHDLEYFFWGHGLSYETQRMWAKQYGRA